MNDPFFDEDDGEFDDLYGNRPSASSSSLKPKCRNTETPAVDPVTPGGRLSTRSHAASSSVVSRSYARDRANSSASTATDFAASGKRDKRRKKLGKSRRRGSQELFDVQWQSDVHVAKCGLCRADFSLVRRKHHCRHCGRVMCSDCSTFLYFEFSNRKHRVCVTCNNQLVVEQEAYDRETRAGGKEQNLFDDLSNDGRQSMTPASNPLRPLVNAHTLETDVKEKKQKILDETAQVTTKVEMSKKQASHHEEKSNGTALFDGADDDWFTDLPEEQIRTRESSDGYSDYSGSKGPGWRDRVKNSYSVGAASEQPSALAPMAGSTLTAGITGKGYISDQFRYDVGGPGLGHEDGFSEKMPQPKQLSATTTYTDHSVKPARLTGNGYFSEQFQYDDIGGPGLGHEDDRSPAMPRPQRPYSYNKAKPSQRHSIHGNSDENTPPEQDFQPRQTFKENLKDVFSGTKRRESTAKKRESKVRTSKPRARGNESMTLDELNPSYSSEDEPRPFASTMPRPIQTPAQSTFYDNDADKLVVDDSPGFFEATIAEREAQRKKEEEQQQQLASDMAWVNSPTLPPTIPSHRFSSGQESYSIIDLPSHTSNSPVESRQGDRSGGDGTRNGKSGLTGALKRFFGMGSKSAKKKAATPKSVKSPVMTTPAKDLTDKHPPAISNSTHPESSSMAEPAPTALEQHTVLDFHGASRENRTQEERFRYTSTGIINSKDVNTHFESSVPQQFGDGNQNFDEVQQKSERKRRGTFDDLFESPKSNVVTGHTDRYTTTAANGWGSRVGENTNPSYATAAVGVSRFDQRRSIDESDGFTLGDEPHSVQPPTTKPSNSTDAWRHSAAMSLLDDRKDATKSEGSGFTWSNVRSVPVVGTATYAVPTSLQSRAVYEDDGVSASHYDTSITQPASLGNIMDDLKRGSTSKKSQGKDSVDDFFAEFEEPNDYVFDPATGGYVASQVPARAAVAPHVSRSESTEQASPQSVPGKDSRKSSGRNYNTPFTPASSSTPRNITSTDRNRGERDDQDEVAEIIVDKISSLESELAALKQLIRNRKGGGDNNIPRVSRTVVKPNVRKQSIFDNDSSEEDDGKLVDPYSASIRPVSTQVSERRPISKKKQVTKHRDSFADLFEDSPIEKETLGGGTSYEALFQTGATTADGDIEVGSDDDIEIAPKRKKTRPKSRRRSSRKINVFVGTKEGSDSDPDFTSLKGRRGKHASRRKTLEEEDAPIASAGSSEVEDGTSVDILPVVMPVKKHIEEEDLIDALFDTSNDRDVTQLYGGDDAHGAGHKSSTLEPMSTIVKSGSAQLVQLSSTPHISDEVNGIPTTAESTKSATPVNRTNSNFSYSLDPLGLDKEDHEEEDFSINWTKMRKTKSRRHKSRKSSSSSAKAVGERTVTDNASEDLALDPNLLEINAEHKVEVNNTPGKREELETTVPNIFLVDAASNWMSISALEEDTVNLSLTGGGGLEDLLQSVDDPTMIMKEDSRSDKQEDGSDPVAIDHDASLTNVTPISSLTNVVLPGVTIDQVDIPLSDSKIMKEPPDLPANEKFSKEENTFDIFDQSGDVDFTPAATTLSGVKSSGEGSDDSDSDDHEFVHETFTFEVQVPKKRPSANELISISATSNASKRKESVPQSPSSADDSIEFGKYATPSAPSSSRTPSVDGSPNDPDDASVEDESVLGKVEAQAFDSDWQRMQAKEKERKKKLQVKQRQAQRDKVLRKQGVSSKTLSNNIVQGSNKSKSKSGKKKKKDTEKDDAARSSSHHKKSSSSRKHRHREQEDAPEVTSSEPPRSLTEL